MSNTDTGGPAFPNVTPTRIYAEGMTLRDYFAAKAMQGLIGSPLCEASFSVNKKAEDAYLIADAMLKARQA
jgi:hypothetical protein